MSAPARPPERVWLGADARNPGGYQSEYGGADFPDTTRDRMDAIHRRLRALARGSGQAAGAEARALLDEFDGLVFKRLAEVEDVAWQELGRGLVALGYGGVWPALFALTGYARDGTYTPGDEQRFLERDDLPVREPPAGWPWLWLAPRGPHSADPGRNGTAT